MDLDALASARHDEWERLDVLSGSARLDGPGAREAGVRNVGVDHGR